MADLRRCHIERYKRHLAERPTSRGRRPAKRTLADDLGTLRICLERLGEWQGEDAPRRMLMFGGDVPKLDGPLPRFIDDGAAAKLLRTARAETDPFARLAVEFLARTGLRRSEFINLKVDSVVQIGSAYWLHVPLGKMRTDRYIPLHPQLKELLDEWVANRPANLREPWLFMDRGHRIGVRRVEEAVWKLARAAEIGHVIPHQPRHALAPQAINRDWAMQIVKSNRSAPDVLASLLSLAVWQQRGDDYPVCEYEWNNVTNPAEDYDEVPVAFSGWLLQPELSGNDVPFTHPFGNDWECMVALDSECAGLLAEGNTVPDGADGAEALADALGLDIPVPSGGILALETDGGCVPSALRELGPTGTVRVGDRIAALGRWIVDAGHSVDVDTGKSYRAEMHPPMMMAIAGTRTDASGGALTRLVLTSRPYLVRQVYTTDTGTIYDDNASDDGPLLAHLNNEIDKLHGVIPSSWSLEAHPKIASKPFSGVHFLRLTVRPPGSQLPGPVVDAGAIEVSFQFTCRSGVGVQVVSAEGGVDVLLVLNSVDYAAPPLPPRQTVSVTKDQLSVASDLITFEQIVSIFSVSLISIADAEHALAHGIETDSYQVGDVDLLDRSHMPPFVPSDNIPGGQGIVVDDGQPYPVFGFLEIRQVPPVSAPGAAGPAAEA